MPDGDDKGSQGDSSKDLAAAVAGIIQKNNGDATKAITQLLDDNYALRQKNADLRGKVPGEGETVLKGDDLKKYQAYVALGDDPKEIKKKITEGETAATWKAEREGSDARKQVAEVAGFKPALFDRLAKQDGLNLKVNTAEKDGKVVRFAVVVGQDGKETPIGDYAKSNWSELLDSLPVAKVAPPPGTPARPNDNTPAPVPGIGNNGETVTLEKKGIYSQF